MDDDLEKEYAELLRAEANEQRDTVIVLDAFGCIMLLLAVCVVWVS